MALVKLDQAVFAHSAELLAQRRAVEVEVVRELLAVEGDVERAAASAQCLERAFNLHLCHALKKLGFLQ